LGQKILSIMFMARGMPKSGTLNPTAHLPAAVMLSETFRDLA